jgi:trehalose synthase
VATVESARPLLGGRQIWFVNATAVGGGVAEMLRSLAPYALGAGIDARWVVIGGSPPFFAVTKELHNQLHGHARRRLGEEARAIYESTVASHAKTLASAMKPGDVVVLHDPQPGALVAPLRDAGAIVIWRSHIGTDRPTPVTRGAWDFLVPYIGPAERSCSRASGSCRPSSATGACRSFAPSIDPTGAKNSFMAATTVEAILHETSLVRAGRTSRSPPGFVRRNAASRLRRRAQVVRYGPGPRLGVDPLVLHLARWDRLKDPVGVMRGFTRRVLSELDAYLVIAGPAPGTVADDPEAEEMFEEVVRAWGALPARKRSRVQLAVLPKEDSDENAPIVNALQRARERQRGQAPRAHPRSRPSPRSSGQRRRAGRASATKTGRGGASATRSPTAAIVASISATTARPLAGRPRRSASRMMHSSISASVCTSRATTSASVADNSPTLSAETAQTAQRSWVRIRSGLSVSSRSRSIA